MKKYGWSFIPFVLGASLSLAFWLKHPQAEAYRDSTWLSFFHYAWFWIGTSLSLAFLAITAISDVFDRVERWIEKRRIDREVSKRRKR